MLVVYAHLDANRYPQKIIAKKTMPTIHAPYNRSFHPSILRPNMYLQKILNQASNRDKGHEECELRREGGATALGCLRGR
jgi:hypothetical protein